MKKYGYVKKLVKVKEYAKRKEKKFINTKIWSWHCATKEKKKLKREVVEQNLGLLENRPRPRMGGHP